MEGNGSNYLHEGRLTPAVCVTGNVNKSRFDKGNTMNFWLILNAIFVILAWKWANEAFAQGHKGLGYFNLAISAMNFAAILTVVV